jgi:hypothetical protein
LETLTSFLIGIGLSAACGFRVFLPLLALSIAANTGYLRLSSGFEWIGTIPALIAFASATLLEVLAYYIPWVDHLLDLLATPTAVVAGIIASASVMTDLPPLLKWSAALIGGGGIAGIVQGATVLSRINSTAFTGGFGNFLLATLELIASAITSLLALFFPLLGLLFILTGCTVAFMVSKRFLFGLCRPGGMLSPLAGAKLLLAFAVQAKAAATLPLSREGFKHPLRKYSARQTASRVRDGIPRPESGN